MGKVKETVKMNLKNLLEGTPPTPCVSEIFALRSNFEKGIARFASEQTLKKMKYLNFYGLCSFEEFLKIVICYQSALERSIFKEKFIS